MAEAKDVDATVSDERRGEDRAAITLTVDYRRLNSFFADYTKNISKGGTFIRTTKPLEIGTEFVFVLTLPELKTDDDEGGSGQPRRIELTGAVKWVVSEAAATQEQPAGMGIQFIFKDDDERKSVEKLVTDLMRLSLGDHLTDKLLTGR